MDRRGLVGWLADHGIDTKPERLPEGLAARYFPIAKLVLIASDLSTTQASAALQQVIPLIEVECPACVAGFCSETDHEVWTRRHRAAG